VTVYLVRPPRLVFKGVLTIVQLQLRQRITERQVMFGCLDTWLLWQLTDQRVFATDYSCASSTMLFDPIQVSFVTRYSTASIAMLIELLEGTSLGN